MVYGVGILSALFSPGIIHRRGAVAVSIAVLIATLAMIGSAATGTVAGVALAACLLGTWALPLPVLEAVAWHHHPTRSSDKGFSLLTAVHAANVFAYELGCGSGTNALPEVFDHPYLLQIGLGDNRNEWRKACNVPHRPEEDAEHAKFKLRRDAKRK